VVVVALIAVVPLWFCFRRASSFGFCVTRRILPRREEEEDINNNNNNNNNNRDLRRRREVAVACIQRAHLKWERMEEVRRIQEQA